ncbi:platelet binding protein GspB [Anastrepha obliqua]|uniref:platelet binding protein GspB n=1 Tax=Anastrepha obliqua TaxID=95512 RepID=UPI00240A59AB|nr:platelet binding protein GspB [Anastrepha obliqua]XP_054742429.1 platelet binding protein GspB [Anastrepha obliqua]
MFRPIKNFINYIQKNASGSAIFGSTTTIADSEVEPGAEEVGVEATRVIRIQSEATQENSERRHTEENRISQVIFEQRKDEDMKRIELNKLNFVNGNSATVNAINGEELNGRADFDDAEDDDIELQIKSSVMLRRPLNRVTSVENLTDEVDGDGGESVELQSHDSLRDHSDAIDADSQGEYDEYPAEGAEAISLVSDDGTAGGGEDTAEEEVITEEEDVEETFLELASHQERHFEDSEIIVLGDVDINSSIASDAPSEDPLAIDDFTQPSISAIKDTSNPLDSSTNDEASTSADLLWSNIDNLKTNIITPNAEKDLPIRTNLDTSTSILRIHLTTSPTTDKEKRNSAVASSDSGSNNATILSTQRDENAEEIRSDGSDSGLGSETSTLQTTLTSLADTSQLAAPSDSSAVSAPTASKSVDTPSNYCSINSSESNVTLADSVAATSTAIVPVVATAAAMTPLTVVSKPVRSNLKRRLEEDDTLGDSSQQTQLSTTGGTQVKKLKRSINFENVQVYYFPRQQGFGCVPSAGGCTLGMGARHIGFKTLTLAEHAAELRRAHRLQLQEINPRGSSSDDSEESEEDYLSEGSSSDLDAESNGFLQPVSPKQRRALLKAAGVRKIDAAEKIECRDIRNSREVCGCACVEFCDPESCACSQAGIKCQVDRAMFPCGCTRDACGNTVGRVEFNPTRVRTHFIHTIMRLEMENRQQQNPSLCGTVSSYSLSAACATTATAVGPHTNALPSTPSYATALPNSYYAMQTQSNYSSGYASPAYPSEPAANYYQQQSSSTTHYSAVSTTELQATTQQNYQLDSLDAGVYAGSATAAPVYGEMLPSYSSAVGVSASTATVSAYHQNLNYATVQQTQVSTYTAYQQTSSAGYLPQHNQQSATVAGISTQPTLPPPTTYSSCAVPSLPPYGTATTTAAASQYQNANSYALVDTTAPSCISIDDSGGCEEGSVEAGGATRDGNGSATTTSNDNSSSCADNTTIKTTSCTNRGNAALNSNDSDGGSDNGSGSGSGTSFIQLSTPISSATRLSQINDLLQHNRHTTATLVAVSHTACLSVSGSTSTLISKRSVTTDCDYNNTCSVDVEEDAAVDEEEKDDGEVIAEEIDGEQIPITEPQQSVASKLGTTNEDENVKAAFKVVATAKIEPPPVASTIGDANEDTVTHQNDAGITDNTATTTTSDAAKATLSSGDSIADNGTKATAAATATSAAATTTATVTAIAATSAVNMISN